MTREEAIIYLECADATVGREIKTKTAEALEMAIEALKAQPCEDAVSREFMYKLGAKCIAVRDKDGELIAIAPIESLPPVTPKTLDSTLKEIQEEIVAAGDTIVGEGEYFIGVNLGMICALKIIDKYKEGVSE